MKFLFIVAGLWALGFPAQLRAHGFDPALLQITEHAPGTYEAFWKAPLTLPGQTVPQFPAWCRLHATTAPAAEKSVQIYRVECGANGLAGGKIDIPALNGTVVEAVVSIYHADGREEQAVLRNHSTLYTVSAPRAPQSRISILGDYFQTGLRHILGGYDHLLFLLGLLLLVTGWRAMVKTITAFTAAHSLSLGLSMYGIANLPQAPVEACIALSIVFLAAELVNRDRSVGKTAEAAYKTANLPPWMLAFAFGLLHGLGFAGALRETGLPANGAATALLGFNAGIEAGQLAVAGAAILLFRPLFVRPRARAGFAYSMGSVAAALVIARLPL